MLLLARGFGLCSRGRFFGPIRLGNHSPGGLLLAVCLSLLSLSSLGLLLSLGFSLCRSGNRSARLLFHVSGLGRLGLVRLSLLCRPGFGCHSRCFGPLRLGNRSPGGLLLTVCLSLLSLSSLGRRRPRRPSPETWNNRRALRLPGRYRL